MIQGIWNKNHNKIQIKKLKFANILTKINAKREMIVILFIKKILRMEIWIIKENIEKVLIIILRIIIIIRKKYVKIFRGEGVLMGIDVLIYMNSKIINSSSNKKSLVKIILIRDFVHIVKIVYILTGIINKIIILQVKIIIIIFKD